MSDRKAELQRKKEKLQAIREEKERRRREKEQKEVGLCLHVLYIYMCIESEKILIACKVLVLVAYCGGIRQTQNCGVINHSRVYCRLLK